MKPYRILALDIATKCGVCFYSSCPQGSDTFFYRTADFSKHMNNYGLLAIDFYDYIESMAPAVVVIETPVTVHSKSARRLTGMAMIAEMFCRQHDIPFREYRPSAIKKFFTGKGNCNKKAMVVEAEQRGYLVQDDNQADAIALMLLHLDEEYGLSI